MLPTTRAIGSGIVVLGALTAACGLWGGGVSTPTGDAGYVVVPGDMPGGPAILLTMEPAVASPYQSQAQVHRWVAGDVYQYEAVLNYGQDLDSWDPIPPLHVVVPTKRHPKARVAFTNLRHASRYDLAVTAHGNIGGTAPTFRLTSTPATAAFEFIDEQDIEGVLNAAVQPALDPVPFNGLTNVNFLAPTEGTFQNPTASESGTVE